jgi:hypothetical protein
MRKPNIEASDTDARISVGLMRSGLAAEAKDMKDQLRCRLMRTMNGSSAEFENQL